MSVTKVLNKQFPEALRSPDTEYQRRLWWTVYCIDRKSAAMLGSPSVMRDEDISIPFPAIKPGDESQNAFAIHAILSSHLGKILDGEFLPLLTRIMPYLTRLQSSMESTINNVIFLLKLNPSSRALPIRMAFCENICHLMFSNKASHFLASLPRCTSFYIRYAINAQLPLPKLIRLLQCVILTVRPVLFSLLKPLLTATGPETNTHCSPSPFESMLKMCIESAVQILKIMSMLKQQMMCGKLPSSLKSEHVLIFAETFSFRMTSTPCSPQHSP
jgi:hypothetical protein